MYEIITFNIFGYLTKRLGLDIYDQYVLQGQHLKNIFNYNSKLLLKGQIVHLLKKKLNISKTFIQRCIITLLRLKYTYYSFIKSIQWRNIQINILNTINVKCLPPPFLLYSYKINIYSTHLLNNTPH